jgi:NADP-dependent 3-hydroxy acid dehydrogenase YdfG
VRIERGTRAIVTGATRGIGEATARALAARGARVGLLARSANELEGLAEELDGDPLALEADVADRKSVEAATAEFIDQAGGLEIAIANAGIAHYAPFADLDPEKADAMVEVNILGTINTVRAALTWMLDHGRGHVVVVSSGAGLRAFPWAAVYGATKAAQRGFAEALRHELSGTGVSLTTVYPGEVSTSLHAHERDTMPDWYRSEDAIPVEPVANAIVEAIEEDRREVHVPRQVRLLGLNGIAPGLVDRILAMLRGGSAAPRRY